MLAIARAVRASGEHEADLFLPSEGLVHNRPENDYPEYKHSRPNWIKESPDYGFLRNLNPFSPRNICLTLADYDLVILSSIYIGLAPKIQGPLKVFFVTGGDLTVLPFSATHRALLGAGPKMQIKTRVNSFLQRRGIASVDFIITQPFSPFVNALSRLGTPASKVLETYFPILIDTDKMCPERDPLSKMTPAIRSEFERFNFRIFHPSRIMTSSHHRLRDAGQWKRNDQLLRAFAIFVKQSKATDAGLFLIEFSGSNASEISKFKHLANELGVSDQVVWLQPPSPRGFPRSDLSNFYSAADLVADDFGAGWFGSICLEGLCAGKPVLSYVDEAAMLKLYPDHPFLSDNTDEGNSKLITKIYDEPTFASSQGRLGRIWVEKHHALARADDIYLKNFNALLAETTPKQI